METSWRRLNVFRLCYQKTSSRRLDQDEYTRLSHTSSEGVFKMPWNTKNCYTEDVVKTSSRLVFKTSSRPTKISLAKISAKGHNTLWKSKQGSNLLSTSHDLGSKYAYNVFKSKNKFWFWETSWKSDTGICFCHP